MNKPTKSQETRTDGERTVRLPASLAALRKQRKLSQEALGERTGMTPRRVSRIENGHVSPRLHEVVVIARVLEVSLDLLVFGEEPGRRPSRSERLLAELRQSGRSEVVAAVETLLDNLALGRSAR